MVEASFVEAIGQDNARLREENQALRTRLQGEKEARDRLERQKMFEIMQLVECLGKEVHIKAGEFYTVPPSRRLFCDYREYARDVVYRIVDDASEIATFERVYPTQEAA